MYNIWTGDRDYLCQLGQTEYVLPEDGDRIQSPKCCVLKINRMVILDKNRMVDNVQKHNIRIS
jgi:hypothetical protein